MENREKKSINYLYILLGHWKTIIITFIVVSVITAGISLTLPRWYRAQTTILPPTSEEGKLGLSSLVGNLPFATALGLGEAQKDTDLLLAILKSRTVMESVCTKFNLIKRYKTKNMEETVKALRKHVAVRVDDEGTVTVMVETGTPFLASKEKVDEAKELSKDMANFFIQELDRINRKLKTEKAHNFRIFVEKRYHQNLADLHRAEDNLKQFQEKYGIVALPEQTKATITTGVELKAQVFAKEIETRFLRNYVGTSHVDYVKVKNELKELRRKYNEFKRGVDTEKIAGKGESKSLFLPFRKIPDFEVQYLRLFREMTFQEKLLEFLLPEYEQAKIQEARDTPTVQVLDKAVRPERKYKPKRALIVIFYGFMSIVLSSAVIFFKPTFMVFYKNLREKNK